MKIENKTTEQDLKDEIMRIEIDEPKYVRCVVDLKKEE